MRAFDELQRLWDQAPRPPLVRGTVRGICRRLGNDVHESPDQVEVTRDEGVVGDRWRIASDPQRLSQITLINWTVAGLVAGDHRPHYDTGDNFHVDLDLAEHALLVGARLRIGEALLQVTPEPHTGCKKFSARFGPDALRWISAKENRPLRLRGLHCEVIGAGVVRVGDVIAVLGD